MSKLTPGQKYIRLTYKVQNQFVEYAKDLICCRLVNEFEIDYKEASDVVDCNEYKDLILKEAVVIRKKMNELSISVFDEDSWEKLKQELL